MVITTPQNGIFQHRVAYILDQQLPAQKANTEQVMNTISSLASEGVNIKLFIPRKWRTLGRSKKQFKQKLIDYYDIQNGFTVSGIFHLPFSPFKIDKISHGILAAFYSMAAKHEIVYTRNSLPALIALVLGKKVVFEVYRIYKQEKRDSVIQYLAQRTQSSNSLVIITHSLPSKESLLQIGAAEKKVEVIPNGFNPDLFTSELTKTEARRQLGWNARDKIACYTGRIDLDKGLEFILDLAGKTPEINYILIGNSQKDTNDWILTVAGEKGLRNIKWSPRVTMRELPKYLFASDVLIIPPTAGPLMRYGETVLPIKTFIYLAAGRCILAPALPDTAGVLNDQNAVLVQPDNLDSAAKAIRKIFEDEGWVSSIAKQAQLDSKNYTWQSRAKRIIEFVNDQFLDSKQ